MDLVKESTSDKLEVPMSNKKQVHSFVFIVAAMSAKKFEPCFLLIAADNREFLGIFRLVLKFKLSSITDEIPIFCKI